MCFVFGCVVRICSVFCIWLCCEDLQCVLYLFVLRICSVFCIWLCCEDLQCFVFGCVSICSTCAVCQMMMFSSFSGAFSVCMCFLKLQLSRPP